jgi:hypothetical protein
MLLVAIVVKIIIPSTKTMIKQGNFDFGEFGFRTFGVLWR